MNSSPALPERDERYMSRALELARLGWGQTAPNPMVGAVVVSGDSVVGEGYHARFGGDHAEVVALRAAGERARGATLYVTLEPCAHYGKTPPCADAIARAGIARVVTAVRDPSELARGGVERLRDAGVTVEVGCQQQAALELNAPFFNAHASPRPWVTLKLALSADDGIWAPPPAPRWITGAAAREYAHKLRANSDAVAVGIGTVLADDPLLTVRDAAAPRCAARRVVFDSSLRMPLGSALLAGASNSVGRRQAPTIDPSEPDPDDGDVVIIAKPGADPQREAALRAAGATVLHAASLNEALRQLRRAGVRSLLVEGGARLAGALVRDDLVDRVITFRAPMTLGPQALGAWSHAPADFAARLAASPIVHAHRFGDDMMQVHALHEVPCSPG